MHKLNTTSARVISINGNANEPTAYAVIVFADIKGKDGVTRATLIGKA